MRVRYYLADQNPQRDRTRGITGYTDGLLRTLAGEPEVTIEAVTSRSSYAPPVGRARTLPWSTERAVARLFSDHLGHRFVPGTPDLWHFPKGYLGGVGKSRAPVVITVHDMILAHTARTHPEARSKLAFTYWLGLTRRSLARADHVLTVSEHARKQIEAFASDARISLPPLTVTYQGARWEDRAGTPSGPKDDYVLCLGSVEPHKQTLPLLSHWSVLQRRHTVPRLYVVGPLSTEAEAAARRCPQITLAPAAEPNALAELMRRAVALVLPSEIEGFGLPALEAFYNGTPVVYVRGTAVDEVLAGAPGGFELHDVDSLEHGIAAALALTPTQITEKALALRERFAWKRCAGRTLSVYRAMIPR